MIQKTYSNVVPKKKKMMTVYGDADQSLCT